MTVLELRNFLQQPGEIRTRGFDILKQISRFVNDEDTEVEGRELVLRALDQRDQFGEFGGILDALTRQVGLFPYLEPDSLNLSDSLAYEFHRPAPESELVFHRVQAEVFRRIMDGENIILSAPTSFGKSRIIDAVISSHRFANIAVIVPTIALIDETRRRLSGFSGHYKVVSQLSQKAGDRNLFVFTAERLIAYENLPRIEFFVIDEFYKIGAMAEDPARTVALNQAFYRLSKGGGQFYLLGPSIRQIPEGLTERYRCYFIPTQFATVATDVVNVYNWNDDLAKLVEIASTISEPTLIFCKSPKRVNEVARTLLAQLSLQEVPDMVPAAQWVGQEYHNDWIFAAGLRRGIGIHHGRLPRSLSQLSVRAFNEEKLRFLICTSTLIEGVNTKAKNVIIFDHVLNRKKFDFFTFNNIKGRSGRMFHHFVGRVFLFHPPPEEELPYVDFPLFTQNDETPESLLVQMDPADLSNPSQERLSGIAKQTDLSLEIIKQNSTIDPQAQVDFAKELASMSQQVASSFWWKGFPSYDQLRTANRLLWRFFVTKPKNDVTSADQLTLRIWSLRRNPGVKGRIMDELKPGRYQAASADEAVERVLSFDRNWAGFEYPRLLAAFSRIQNAVFTSRFGNAGNYMFYAARVEQLFRDGVLIALEEYGLPFQVGEKLIPVFGKEAELDHVLETLKNIPAQSLGLAPFEQQLLVDVQRGL